MSMETRYRYGSIVFENWYVQEMIRTDPGTSTAYFRLVHKDNPSVQSALKVITLLQEAGHPSQLAAAHRQALEGCKARCKETAAGSIQLMQRLRGNPYVVNYHDYTFVDWQGQADFGCDVMVRTDYLQDLGSELQAGHYFSEAEILRIASDAAAALNLFHSQQHPYRSLRPDNIFFGTDGVCKLGDTVAADLQSVLPAPTVIGPAYCAPEQFRGEHYAESDFYSLGLVLYQLSNGGCLPFAATPQVTEDAINARLQGYPLPQPRQAGPVLASVVARACAFQPSDRYHSAPEFLADLNRTVPVIPTVQPQIQQPQVTQPPKDSSDKNRNLTMIVCTAVITVLVLLVLGVGIFFYMQLQDKDSNPSGNTKPPAPTTLPPVVATTPPTISTEPVEATEPTERTLPESHYYYSCYNPQSEFVLPESSSRYYTPAEIKNLTDKQLDVALAEIPGRYGAVPSNQVLADYFSYLSWFVPSSNPYSLNDFEKANMLLINTQQQKRNGTMDMYSNRFLRHYDSDDGHFMEAGSSRYLTSRDLKDLSTDELVLVRNEIFARHGFIFSSEDIMVYFYYTDWYVPKYPSDQFSYELLSREELMNLELILVYENIIDYSGPDRDNPYIPYLSYPEYILPNSAHSRLQESDLEGLDDTQLYLAECEIYARHGLAFAEDDLLHYFLECSWYSVEVGSAYADRIDLSSTERANLELIRYYRETR